MTVYLVGHIDIVDHERYADYEAGFRDVFAKHEGEVLAADDDAEMLEGERLSSRTVVLRFPDRDRALAWYRSPEYQQIAAIRWEASNGVVAILQGF